MGKYRGSRFPRNEVKRIAMRYRYCRIPLKASEAMYMWSFKPQNIGGCESISGPVRIDVYFTTGTVVTTSPNQFKKLSKRVFKSVHCDLQKLTEIFSGKMN